MKKLDTNIVSGLENLLHFPVHIVMVQGHEESVDDDAERDKEFDERVEDYECHPFLELQPHPTTIPNAKNIDAT